MFNRLVQKIGICFPSGSTNSDNGTSGEDGGPFLICEVILDITNPQRDLAKWFARKVKHPRFRYITPGLEVSNCFSHRRAIIYITSI
jgi:hypothetical protein